MFLVQWVLWVGGGGRSSQSAWTKQGFLKDVLKALETATAMKRRKISCTYSAAIGQLLTCHFMVVTFVRKIPAPIRIKLALPPPPSKKPQNPPLLRGGILWTWGFSSRKNQKIPGAHKLARPSIPRIVGGKNYGNQDFSEFSGRCKIL